MLHPVETATIPVAESESHIRDVGSHVLKIVAAVSGFHNQLAALLRHGHSVAIELAVLLEELSFDVEFFLGVDLILASLSVLANCIVEDIESALATSVAVGVNSVDGVVALVSCSVEGVSIGLLNVKLRAPVATNSIGIAVLEGVLGIVDGGHEDGVKGGDTAAADCAQVNIVLESASE